MSGAPLTRTVGLLSATFIIIGYVVGATIFILPGSIAADVGPAAFLAYGIAAIPAIIAGLVFAQIGAALPVSGATYVILRDALSPIAGFIYLWIIVWLAAAIIPLIAYGFADYLGYFLTGFNSTVVAALITLAFIACNIFGMRVAASVQNLLVVAMLIALAVFAVGGVAAGDPELMRPLFPRGFSPILIAAITAYFSYAGIIVVAEIAGEIKDPGRNIPRAILLAFVLIVALYILVPLALVMLLPWQDSANSHIAVVTAAQVFLPEPVVVFVAMAALFAAATSINGILMGFSRDIYQGAAGNSFPPWLAKVNARSNVPVRAVSLVGGLSLLGILAGATIMNYAQLAMIGMMLIQIMSGIALMRMPKVLKASYEQSGFRLSPGVLKSLCVAHVLFSTLFLVLLSTDRPELLTFGFIYLLLGVACYMGWQRLSLRNKST